MEETTKEMKITIRTITPSACHFCCRWFIGRGDNLILKDKCVFFDKYLSRDFSREGRRLHECKLKFGGHLFERTRRANDKKKCSLCDYYENCLDAKSRISGEHREDVGSECENYRRKEV